MAPVEEMSMIDFDRSNKGASKQRRDQINAEIATMRDLLPLPESSRQRLSQLQIMSLTCVYVRKCNILHKLFRSKSQEKLPDSTDFFQALSGFVLVTTRDGKLLYISENVTDYLGHSMVDMKTQGDSLYDIVDKRDHNTVQAQLLHGAPHHIRHGQHSASVLGQDNVDSTQDVSFFCRMNMSRTLKRQSGFGDVK
ncbi:neuronal pas domain-containing protein 4, partial [Plakobranchus ocellatus]